MRGRCANFECDCVSLVHLWQVMLGVSTPTHFEKIQERKRLHILGQQERERRGQACKLVQSNQQPAQDPQECAPATRPLS